MKHNTNDLIRVWSAMIDVMYNDTAEWHAFIILRWCHVSLHHTHDPVPRQVNWRRSRQCHTPSVAAVPPGTKDASHMRCQRGHDAQHLHYCTSICTVCICHTYMYIIIFVAKMQTVGSNGLQSRFFKPKVRIFILELFIWNCGFKLHRGLSSTQ